MTIENVSYQNDREALTIGYAVFAEEDYSSSSHSGSTSSLLHVAEDTTTEPIDGDNETGNTRSLDFILPASEGWDVQLTTRASTVEVENLPWVVEAWRVAHHLPSHSPSSYPPSTSSEASSSSAPYSGLPVAARGSANQEREDQVLVRITHNVPPSAHAVLKVRVVLEISSKGSGVRVNGIAQRVSDGYGGGRVQGGEATGLMRDVKDVTGSSRFSLYSQNMRAMSFMESVNTLSSVTTGTSGVNANAPSPLRRTATNASASPYTHGTQSSVSAFVVSPAGTRTSERTPAADKSILSRVKRNYIYFSSLLQEPEAKWKRGTFISFVFIYHFHG